VKLSYRQDREPKRYLKAKVPTELIDANQTMLKAKPVHADLRNAHYCDWLEFLNASESWSAEQLRTYQLSEIKRAVRHAYEHTKAYRELYDSAGVGPDSIQTLEDVAKLPIVDKEAIRERLEDFSAHVQNRLYVTTGGSTGIPFGFYRDKRSFSKELASKAHQYHRIGWKEGDRQFVFRGLPIKGKNRMQFYPRFNELRCSSYYLVPELMEAYRKRAFEYRPEWIRSYPSSAYIFAQFLRDTGRAFPPVKGILCASENLYDFQKETLQEVFGTRVFSHYGHYEMAALAGFCEYEDTYHVLPQYGYAELMGPDGRPVTEPGQRGEIVATSFIMEATPFIKYRTRDFATLKSWECSSCGRPYHVWERIDGRLQEFIVTSTGRLISMTAINMHDNIFDHIRQFQFFQEQRGRLTFKFIPKETCVADVVADMRKRLLIKLGDDVALEMESVPEISLTARGKHRFLIQKLSLESLRVAEG
jgi:phenylacetate-CoA ligase